MALQKLVWNDYIERMVMRKGSSRSSPLGETRAWLSYLAGQMRDHNQAVFYLEHLQPDWLTASQRRAYAWFAVRLPAIVIGILVTLFVMTSAGSELSSVLFSGFLGGLLGGLCRGRMLKQEKKQEHRHVWGKRLVRRLTLSACIGLIGGLISGFSHFPYYTLEYFLPSLVGFGLISLLLQYLLPPFRSDT